MRIRGFYVRDPCEFVLDPSFAPLFKDFEKKVDLWIWHVSSKEKKIGFNL